MTGQLVFIHLSDIHFSRSSGSTYDLDDDLRKEVVSDAIGVTQRIGVPQGILVSGDIAYSGKKEQFDFATEWLNGFCTSVGCQKENVWVTPGNHDVDRDVIAKSPTIQDYHFNFRSKRFDVDTLINRYCSSEDIARQILYTPIEAYNIFASKYGCAVNADNPFWEHVFALGDGYSLKIRGLSTTLISNSDDDNGANKLALGSIQSLIPRVGGCICAVLCHHPPQWLIDEDTTEGNLNARVTIQLFGHKHDHNLRRIDDTLRIISGAMHPERFGVTWLPRYNILKIYIEIQNTSRNFVVEVFPRVWSNTEKKFVADFGGDGSEMKKYSFRVEAVSPNIATPLINECANATDVAGNSMHSSCHSDQNSQLINNDVRKLAYLFLSLPHHQKTAIAAQLNLLSETDNGLSPIECYKEYFKRADESNRLHDLWEMVTSHFSNGNNGLNPFE